MSTRLKTLNLFLLIFTISFFSTKAAAWWGIGHEIVATIAYNNLSSEAKKQVDALLKEEIDWPRVHNNNLPTPKELSHRLSDHVLASTWADVIKNYKWVNAKEAKIYASMHYMDITMHITPPIDKNFSLTNDCSQIDWRKATDESITDKKNREVVSGTISAIKTLLSNESKEHKAIALRFLIHWGGDAYMPFHMLDTTFSYKDKNRMRSMSTRGETLLFFTENSRVKAWAYNPDKPSHPTGYLKLKDWHSFWDGLASTYSLPEPINHQPNGSGWARWIAYNNKYRDYINSIANEIQKTLAKDPINVAIKDNADPKYWAADTAETGCKLLSTKYYGKPLILKFSPKANHKAVISFVDENYEDYRISVKPIATKQIYEAGLHLAYLLNAIFAPKTSANEVSTTQKRYDEYINTVAKSNTPTLTVLVEKILNQSKNTHSKAYPSSKKARGYKTKFVRLLNNGIRN